MVIKSKAAAVTTIITIKVTTIKFAIMKGSINFIAIKETLAVENHGNQNTR